MRDARLDPDGHSFSALISCCKGGREAVGQWKVALELLGDAEQRDCADIVVYSAAIAACASGPLPKQHNVFKKNETDSQRIQSDDSSDAAIENNGNNGCERLQQCFDILARMREKQVHPNVYTYTSIMSALEKRGMWQKAISLLDTMRLEQVSPNVKTYSSAISACGKGLNWQKSLELLQDMVADNVTPNLVVYNAALSACEKGGAPEQALSLLSSLREHNLKPDLFTYIALIASCSRLARWELAISFLDEMEECGVRPTKEIWTGVITACGKAYEWRRALELLERMERSLPASSSAEHVLTSVISACGRVGRWKEALRFLRTIPAERRSELHYNSLLLSVRSSVLLNGGNNIREEEGASAAALPQSNASAATLLPPSDGASEKNVGSKEEQVLQARCIDVFDILADMRSCQVPQSLLLAKTCLLTLVTTACPPDYHEALHRDFPV